MFFLKKFCYSFYPKKWEFLFSSVNVWLILLAFEKKIAKSSISQKCEGKKNLILRSDFFPTKKGNILEFLP